ncbi:GTP diphosphokinase [Candidatus Endobugula sertula]|uniref:GTP pyrophosphokinase n=1 Tax=Candidatus Endobugula sertula TaxID=62101 RepID=A0A1D2QPE8_9GAMM|nr:GTP diphosphokinase [Candidatus Endobugula sertula]
MVKVREDYPVTSNGELDFNQWAQRMVDTSGIDPSAQTCLVSAATVAQLAEEETSNAKNLWSDRSSSTLTGLEMADILAELQLDQDALVAAVVYRSVREDKISLRDIGEQFGQVVAGLVEGVLGMAAISHLRNDSEERVFGKQSAEQIENVRRMLVSMVDDVRVALIKLAERTCAIRAVKEESEARKRKVAREVFDIYAPLAHRLGIGHIKWELEDLGFRYLKPDEYKSIAKLLDEKRLDRQDYIDNVVSNLNTQIRKSGIDAEVHGRAKHIYSIWRKMQRKRIGFSEVYDIRALRILVPNTKDCYEVLGIVHTLWRNIPHEFDDYVAAPKENGYRSLHTAVTGPGGKVIEVQIRSHSMHEEAEYGVCSHWRYKGTDADSSENSYEQKIEWLRQVLDWHEELGVDSLRDDLGSGIEQDRVYLFTPGGHVVDLPARSTPLDFAYRIHTEIGHCCRGAKVNGSIVPLNHQLSTGDQVEILTGKQTVPSRDWLTESLGYLNTTRARAKVRHWFGEQAREQNIADGRALLDNELKRLAIRELNFEQLLTSLKEKTLDDLYAHLGSGDVSLTQVLKAVQQLVASNIEEESQVQLYVSDTHTSSSAGNDVYIEGVGNLLTNIARCCHPLPGDEINGYITLGKGVSIHRKDCRNVLQLATDEPERIIQVSWGEVPRQTYTVDINIEAYDRIGLLRDVISVLDSAHNNITSMQTSSNKGDNTVYMMITMDIRDFAQLSQILARLNQLPNVASARRKH